MPESIKSAYGVLRSMLIYRRPGRQRSLKAFYRAFVKPGELVFDIGAHLGDRTTAFAGLGARVIALEPQPQLFAWLQRLTRRNQRVVCLPQAAGAFAGTLELATSRINPTVASLSSTWRERVVRDQPGFAGVHWDTRLEVPVITLDELISRYGEPVFCKVDVEGFEAEVLAGLSRPLQSLSLEFVGGALDQAVLCVDRLGRLGSYRFQVVEGEQRRFFLNDWVSARSIRGWLAAGADGLASGDLYALRVD